MNWRGPKAILSLLIGTLCLIYFATVFWEPDSADSGATRNYLRELGDPIETPDAVQPENIAPPRPESRPLGEPKISYSSKLASLEVGALKASELHGFTIQLTDSGTGDPLTDAEVRVYRAARSDSEALAILNPDYTGKVTLGHLPHAQYRIEVEAPGYHPIEPQAVEIPVDGEQFKYSMNRASEIVGFFEGLNGERVPMGLLRIRHVSGQPSFDIRPDAYGQFSSPPLKNGAWDVFWLRHSQGEIDPRLHEQIRVEPGDRVSLTVVLDDGERLGGREISITTN
jgi:hypothetical protein